MPQPRRPEPRRGLPRPAADAVRDLRGGMRLVFDGVQRAIDGAEQLQARMAGLQPRVRMPRVSEPGSGWSTHVYRGVRSTAELVGGSLDFALASVQAALLSPQRMHEPAAAQPLRDALVAALNGVAGDHLHATDNPLAQRLRLHPRGTASARLLVLVHDLGMNDAQWRQQGHDHGQALAAALGCTPVYVLYNSGRPVAENGRELAAELEQLLGRSMPAAESLAGLGHGLGGLVLRSALQQALRAGMAWPHRLDRLVFLGTPHRGGDLPLQARRLLQASGALPAALARLAGHTSAGMQDFMDGRVAREEPPSVLAPQSQLAPADAARGTGRWYAVAGSVGGRSGDGLVPVDSALGRHAQPALALQLPGEQCWIAEGVDHLGLLGSEAVFQKVRHWLAW